MKHVYYRCVGVLVLSISLFAIQDYAKIGSTEGIFQTARQKKKLFESVGCSYMNKMILDCSDCLQSGYDTDYFKANKDEILKLSRRYHNDVVRFTLAPMYLKFISSKIGYGIFATKPIQRDQFIGVYAGEVREIRWDDATFKEDLDYAWMYPVDAKNGKKTVVDAKYRGNELRFINHANNPNTRRIDVMVDGIFYACYIATRYIPQDTQLTVSYGDSYWTTRRINPDDAV